MSSDRASDAESRNAVSRRSFLQTSGGVATGIAVTVLPTGAVALAAPGSASAHTDSTATRVTAEGDVPAETVMAYVHDAAKGIVTVMSGTAERTYHDPVLAKRLLDAAHQRNA